MDRDGVKRGYNKNNCFFTWTGMSEECSGGTSDLVIASKGNFLEQLYETELRNK